MGLGGAGRHGRVLGHPAGAKAPSCGGVLRHSQSCALPIAVLPLPKLGFPSRKSQSDTVRSSQTSKFGQSIIREGTSSDVPIRPCQDEALAAEGILSRPPRDSTSLGSNAYFVTSATWGHRPLFQTDRMATLFIETISHYRREGKFLLHEFVAMPDHVHLLFTPTGVALERAVQLVKGGLSYRVKKDLGVNTEIWEHGYVDHRIRDPWDYAKHVNYIHDNPVKAGLVASARDFPYSSAHGGFELDPCPQGLKPWIGGGVLRHG